MLVEGSLRYYCSLYCEEDLTDGEIRHLFPDELMDYTFCPYQGKLREVSEYNLNKDSYEEIRICLLKNLSGKLIKVPCMFSEEKKFIFIDNRVFDKYWKKIAEGLRRGFNKQRVAEHGLALKDVNQCVDLRWMETPTREAKINDQFVIELKGKEIDIEHQRMISKRAAAMDNHRMKFVYSKANHMYHDKSCRIAAQIPFWDFEASERIPEGRVQCPECCRASMIRNAIGDDGKRFAWYMRFFERGNLKLEVLKNFLKLENLKMHMTSPNEMVITYQDDTWKVVLNQELRYVLFHNNYYIKDGERFTKQDFHLQLREPGNLQGILHYIATYDWTSHLVAVEQEKVLEITDAKITIRERIVAFWDRVKSLFRVHAVSF